VQRTKIRDYWELSKKKELKQETIDYVPKLIAVSYVLSQPRRFGINLWQESTEWTTMTINRQVSIDLLASESGADRNIMRKLNAELLNGITPVGTYQIKVPAAFADEISAVMEREDISLIRYHYHIVRHGDTLWSMSRHYGASLEIIEQHNPGIGSRYLKIGETVIIPALREVNPPQRKASNLRFDGKHVVVKGDTLWSLAIRYGTDPETLAEANDMGLNAILREGRALKVPIIE
jgi:membrane-bound lytic murein transglycosylase D